MSPEQRDIYVWKRAVALDNAAVLLSGRNPAKWPVLKTVKDYLEKKWDEAKSY